MKKQDNVLRLKKNLRKYASKEKAKLLERFFKTGPGEYAQGDKFIGVQVSCIRSVVKEFKDVFSLNEAEQLLKSSIHEERLAALLILISKFKESDQRVQDKIHRLYLKNTRCINNWDLVDLSAKHITGAYLLNRDKKILYDLARSRNLWKRRIAVLSCFHYIGLDKFDDCLKIARVLINDEHDLIHKAVGWMLREIGKRDLKTEEVFLKKHYKSMPRTMLRYAIERFEENKRLKYLKGVY